MSEHIYFLHSALGWNFENSYCRIKMKHKFYFHPHFKNWNSTRKWVNTYTFFIRLWGGISNVHIVESKGSSRENNSQIQIMPPCLGGTRAREAPRISDCCFFFDSKMHTMLICSYAFGNSVKKHLCINKIIYHHFFFIFSKFEAYSVISWQTQCRSSNGGNCK